MLATRPGTDPFSLAVTPADGAHLTLRSADGASMGARVLGWDGAEALVLPDHVLEPGLPLGIRYVDEDGAAWDGRAVTRRSNLPGALALGLLEPLARTASRGAVRAAVRRPRLRMITSRRALDMIALDLSSTGCLAACTCAPPSVGEQVRLLGEAPLGEAPAPIHGQVVRVSRGAFGRREVAIRFDLDRPGARRRIFDWRSIACA